MDVAAGVKQVFQHFCAENKIVIFGGNLSEKERIVVVAAEIMGRQHLGQGGNRAAAVVKTAHAGAQIPQRRSDGLSEETDMTLVLNSVDVFQISFFFSLPRGQESAFNADQAAMGARPAAAPVSGGEEIR